MDELSFNPRVDQPFPRRAHPLAFPLRTVLKLKIECRFEPQEIRDKRQRNRIDRVAEFELVAEEPHPGEGEKGGRIARGVGKPGAQARRSVTRTVWAKQDPQAQQRCCDQMQRFEPKSEPARSARKHRPSWNRSRLG